MAIKLAGLLVGQCSLEKEKLDEKYKENAPCDFVTKSRQKRTAYMLQYDMN